MVSLRFVTKLAGSEVGFVAKGWINSGSLSVVPYTSSVVVHWRSSLSADRMPRSTHGSASTQRSGWG